jgi:hypothetical protein
VSNTFQREISWLAGGEDADKAFENNHVLFQKEAKDSYIQTIFDEMLS